MNTNGKEKKDRRVIVWMTPSEAENISCYAAERDMSRSALVRAALKSYMSTQSVDVPDWMYRAGVLNGNIPDK